MALQKVTRRDFLRNAGLGTGALVLGCHLSGGGMARALFAQEAGSLELNTFVAIRGDGTVVIITHRSEMGQGIRTTLPAIVAEELEVDWNRVVLQQAIGDEKYGSQWTDGSRSVTLFYQKMREAGATAKHMLMDAAAQRFGVDISQCEARDHKVFNKATGASLDYGELAQLASRLKVPAPEDVQFKSPADFRYIGTENMPFYDLDDMVTGRAVYGADVDIPGMKTAMIVRCPVIGGTVKSFDRGPTLAISGVRKVFEFEGKGGLGGKFKPLGGVAVIADNTWAALKGRWELEKHIEWDYGPNAKYESQAYRAKLEASTAGPGKQVRNRGDVNAAFGSAAKVVEAGYYVPHLAQAQMEPLVAVAHLQDGHLQIWAPTQSPQAAQATVEEVLGLEHTKHGSAYEKGSGSGIRVTVHVTLLGGGFGRKSKPDFVAEAAILAHANPGVPIKVQWSREDDMMHGYFHAVSHQYLKGALDGDGKPTAWLQRSAFPTLVATVADANAEFAGNIELGQGLVDMPFDVPNIRLENCRAKAHARIGWMRSVANVYHGFAIGSFADELAIAAGRDSKDYLLELIGNGAILDVDAEIDTSIEGVPAYDNYGASKEEYPVDTARLRNVVEYVAREAGWGKEMPAGRGLGIAAHRSFLSYVAVVVDASVSATNTLEIHEVHIAIDCGLAVNRERVRSQLEGGVIYALSSAIHDEITFRDGRIEQRNFHDYPTLRLNQTPKKIATYIVDSDGPPGGVGEPPVPPVAPALTNAIVAAGGPRVRDLPLWKVFDFG